MNQKEMIKVLIADDSVFIRQYLSELLGGEPSLEVVGVACSGDEVIQLSSKLHPDVITMDYQMPGKTGLEAAAAIMLGSRPLPSIIMLSAFSGEEGEEVRRTLEESGAQVVSKPSGEVSLDIEKVSKEIVSKVKAAGEESLRLRTSSWHALGISEGGSTSSLQAVLVIGASTGGPQLVEYILTSLDPKLGIGVVVVQHMSKYFTKLFAERLDRVTEFSVKEASLGDELLPGNVLVVPGGTSLRRLQDGDEDIAHGSRFAVSEPSGSLHEEAIDLTMQTIAQCFGRRTIGVLLSGMGSDGTEGLRAIRENGGYTIAQDPKTAIVSSMPSHAEDAQVVDEELSVDAIPLAIVNKLYGTLPPASSVIQ